MCELNTLLLKLSDPGVVMPLLFVPRFLELKNDSFME